MVFTPPEMSGTADDVSDEVLTDLQAATPWDVAVRYHEFKAQASLKHLAPQLRRLSAAAVLERARSVLGAVVHPVDVKSAPWNEVPSDAGDPDLDLEETLEQRVPMPDEAVEPWMSYRQRRSQSVVLAVDTSLSMTGEKLALTAVALAVVLLQFPDDPIGVVAFENEASVLKHARERISIDQFVERFLDVPAQGYTHLEDGLRSALRLTREAGGATRGRPPSAVLITDGKYTAGSDPAYLAPKFPHLIVLKMGRERASLELCRELARKGDGVLHEVGEYESLPAVMYGVVKDLLRGRSQA